jgi:hypothetical protein
LCWARQYECYTPLEGSEAEHSTVTISSYGASGRVVGFVQVRRRRRRRGGS